LGDKGPSAFKPAPPWAAIFAKLREQGLGTDNRHSGREQLSSSHPTTHLDALAQSGERQVDGAVSKGCRQLTLNVGGLTLNLKENSSFSL
jgi:hypothetical protein